VLDVGGYWDGDGEFEVIGTDSVLHIATGTTLANDVFVVDGTLEVAGTFEYGWTGSSFINATLEVLEGGKIVDGSLTLVGSALQIRGDQSTENTGLFMVEGSTLTLNGHDVTLASLSGDGSQILNNAATAATLTVDTAIDCGCGGLSFFIGSLSDGVEGSGA